MARETAAEAYARKMADISEMLAWLNDGADPFGKRLAKQRRRKRRSDG